jgi:hypothetical protein
MDELEYKVVKSMFSINQIQEVPQVEIDSRDMEFSDVSLQESTKIKKEQPKAQSNANPLFANPNQAPKTSPKKTKIRV